MAMLLEPGPATGRLALAHQHGELPLGVGLRNVAEADLQQAPGGWIQRRLPELLGGHLAQALETGDGPAAFTQAILAQLLLHVLELALVEAIELAQRPLALRRHVHAKERRPRDEDVAGLDEPGEVTEEEREQQHLDVR